MRTLTGRWSCSSRTPGSSTTATRPWDFRTRQISTTEIYGPSPSRCDVGARPSRRGLSRWSLVRFPEHLPRVEQQARAPEPDHPGRPEVAAGQYPDADEACVDDDVGRDVGRQVSLCFCALARPALHRSAAGEFSVDAHTASPPSTPLSESGRSAIRGEGPD